MSEWKLKINENQYREDNYRVVVGHFETLSLIKLGCGSMGSAQHGLLTEDQAIELKRDIENTIQFSQYDELTTELRDRLIEKENELIETINQ